MQLYAQKLDLYNFFVSFSIKGFCKANLQKFKSSKKIFKSLKV